MKGEAEEKEIITMKGMKSMKGTGFLVCLLTSAFCLSADTLPLPYRWEVETSKPAPQTLLITRGETLYLEPAFLAYSAPVVLSNVATVAMRYRSADMVASGTYYMATGYVHSATGGTVRLYWSPTNEAPATNYQYVVYLADAAGAAMLRAYGSLRLASTVDGAGTNRPTAYSSIDWDTTDTTGTPPWPTTFAALSDAPATYSGQSLKLVRVKVTEDGLEFAAGAGAGVDAVTATNGVGTSGTASEPVVQLTAGTLAQIATGVSAYATAAAAAAGVLTQSGRVDAALSGIQGESNRVSAALAGVVAQSGRVDAAYAGILTASGRVDNAVTQLQAGANITLVRTGAFYTITGTAGSAAETDPVFGAWLVTNTYVKSERFVYATNEASNGGVRILDYIGTSTNVIIPAMLGDLPVNQIVFFAFQDHAALRAVTIPETMLYLWEEAFYDCTNLQSITFLGPAPSVVGSPAPWVNVHPACKVYYQAGLGDGFGTNFWGLTAEIAEKKVVASVSKDGAVLTPDTAGQVTIDETDPVFTNWIATNTYVRAESDPRWTASTNASGVQIGEGATANIGSGIGSVSIGYHATSQGSGVAVGDEATASDNGIAIGLAPTVSGNSVGIGQTPMASAGGVAIGNGAAAPGGVAIGQLAMANETGIAIGPNADATGGVGIGGDATGSGSIAIGAVGPCTATATDAIQLGWGSNTNSGTLQVLSYQLMDANGMVPTGRLPSATSETDPAFTNWIATNSYIKALPQTTNVFAWGWLVAGTNWGPLVATSNSLSRVDLQTASGAYSVSVHRCYRTNAYTACEMILTNLLIDATARSYSITSSVPGDYWLGYSTAAAVTQRMKMAVRGVQ